MSVARRGPARSLPGTCEPASGDGHRRALDFLARGPGKRPRAITRCRRISCAIAVSAPAVAGVPRWLRAYKGRAMLQRVLVAAWSARSRRTTMHRQAFSSHRQRPAGLAGSRFGLTRRGSVQILPQFDQAAAAPVCASCGRAVACSCSTWLDPMLATNVCRAAAKLRHDLSAASQLSWA